LVDSRDKIGEGAFWCPEEGAIYWLDVPMPSRLHRYTPATGKIDSWPMPEAITAMAKRRDGTLLIASENGINVFDPKTQGFEAVAAPEKDKPRNRSNDGAPDAKGRFWIGTMQNNLGPDGAEIPITEPSGALWRIEPNLSATQMESGISITNGVAWSPDNETFYVVDSMIQTIFAYDFDLERGTISNKRIFSEETGIGVPDGNAVDAEGHIWSARWDGHCVARLKADGKVDYIVPVPSSRATSCAFGGPDLATLFVTTSRLNVDDATLERYPQQGGLFAFRPGVKGLPRPQFAG
jgi:sugar lactone lactonase YvrE